MRTASLTRIGVFYDGNFFSVVSNYYAYVHERKARLSLGGLHAFVRKRVAHEEQVDERFCQIVDIHYFRGRFSASETAEKGRLLPERQFDDVLVREGVTTHYLPMGPDRTEKGIDVWFALEAYEMAIHKAFDVCVLIACDSDYLPLARKLATLGTRVMVLGWDFTYEDGERERTTKTSQVLLDEVSYPILMSSIIEDRSQRALANSLFLPRKERRDDEQPVAAVQDADAAERRTAASGPVVMSVRHLASRDTSDANASAAATRHLGRIANVIERTDEAPAKRFGWIRPDDDLHDGANLYFAHYEMDDPADFGELESGTRVSFVLGHNPRGPAAKRVRVL